MRHMREKEPSIDMRKKRQQILDAAYLVFSAKGYHRATVDEIIALADTGKGTVYNYFVNKERLFYTVITERSAPFEEALERIVESAEPPLVKIEAAIREFLDFYMVNADLWRVLMHEVRGLGSEGYSNFTPEQREKYRAWFLHTIGILEKILQEGINQGVFRVCNIPQIGYALFSVIVMMVFQKLVGEDTTIAARNIADTFLHGIVKK